MALPCFAGPGGVKCSSLHALSTTQWQKRGDRKPNLPPPFTTTSNALSRLCSTVCLVKHCKYCVLSVVSSNEEGEHLVPSCPSAKCHPAYKNALPNVHSYNSLPPPNCQLLPCTLQSLYFSVKYTLEGPPSVIFFHVSKCRLSVWLSAYNSCHVAAHMFIWTFAKSLFPKF